MERANVFDQRIHVPANRIDVTALAADDTRVFAVGCVALEREALAKSELARLHDFRLVSLLDDCAWCALSDHPEVVGCYIEDDTASWALAWTAGCEVGGKWLVARVLEIEAVAAEELISGVHDGGRCASRWCRY